MSMTNTEYRFAELLGDIICQYITESDDPLADELLEFLTDTVDTDDVELRQWSTLGLDVLRAASDELDTNELARRLRRLS